MWQAIVAMIVCALPGFVSVNKLYGRVQMLEERSKHVDGPDIQGRIQMLEEKTKNFEKMQHDIHEIKELLAEIKTTISFILRKEGAR